MKTRLRDVIGAGMVGAFVGALFVLFWKAIPQTNEQIITYMIGQLSGFAATIIAYHYATNVQSQQATANTGDAFKAITETAKAAQAGTSEPDVTLRPGETAQAEEAKE